MKRGLLVDFAGTLFLPLNGRQWAAAAASRIGADLTSRDIAAGLVERLHLVRYPGRDLSPAAHRASMLPVLESLTADARLALVLYDVQFSDEFWHLRDGALELLLAACRRQMGVAVVSNVPWDIRALFTRAGLTPYIDAFALSYEIGAEKPDPAIFARALSLIGCAPSDAVMIGDDAATDAGALQLGIPVLLVPRPPANDADRTLSLAASWLAGRD